MNKNMKNGKYSKILMVLFIILVIALINTNLVLSAKNSDIKNKTSKISKNKAISQISQTLKIQTYKDYKPASPPQEINIEFLPEPSPTPYTPQTPSIYEYSSGNKSESEIILELNKKNFVPVIIEIKDNNLNINNWKEYKRMIKENQEQVLNTLENSEFIISNIYKTVNKFSGEITEKGLQKLINNGMVKFIYLDRTLQTALTESIPLINGDDVHNMIVNGKNLKGQGQVICVIDGGVDYRHSDLGGCFGPDCKVIGGFDFVDNDNNPMDEKGHGTTVAGAIIANGGVTGIAPEAKIAAARACDSQGNCPSSKIIAAADWCIDNAQSLGITVLSTSIGDNKEYTNANCPSWMNDVINVAYNRDLPFTVSSGNNKFKNGISYPACAQNIISVGAVYDADIGETNFCLNGDCSKTCTDETTRADKVACFTNTYTNLDIMAPGCEVKTTKLNGGYTLECGTSIATPIVAGTIALMKQANSDLKVDDIVAIIKGNNVQVTDEANSLSFPRIDAFDSVNFHPCTIPTNAMRIKRNTFLCPGTYNLPQGIFINANDITLDCQGAKLVGDGTNFRSGVANVGGFNNIVIKNCNIDNYDRAIQTYASSAGNIISLNNIINSKNGIILFGSNSIVENNEISNSERAIQLKGQSNTAKNNTITDSKNLGGEVTGGIFVFGSNSVIEGNKIRNVGRGIEIADISINNNVKLNEILNMDLGIFVIGSSNSIDSNDITNSKAEGIFIPLRSSTNTITNNIIKNNQIGIRILDNDNKMNNNYLVNNIDFDLITPSSGEGEIIDTKQNWWGTNDLELIKFKIKDKLDDSGLVEAIIAPIIENPIQIPAGNRPPILNPVGDKTIRVGEEIIIDLEAIDPDNDMLRFSTNAFLAMNSFTFDFKEGKFIWKPTASDVGNYRLSFKVWDGYLSDEEIVNLKVMSQSTQFIRGDANMDGAVDISDPIKILLYQFSGLSLSCLDAADANDDGRIDVSDAQYLTNHLFKAGPAPKPPYPEKGQDITKDSLSC